MLLLLISLCCDIGVAQETVQIGSVKQELSVMTNHQTHEMQSFQGKLNEDRGFGCSFGVGYQGSGVTGGKARWIRARSYDVLTYSGKINSKEFSVAR